MPLTQAVLPLLAPLVQVRVIVPPERVIENVSLVLFAVAVTV